MPSSMFPGSMVFEAEEPIVPSVILRTSLVKVEYRNRRPSGRNHGAYIELFCSELSGGKAGDASPPPSLTRQSPLDLVNSTTPLPPQLPPVPAPTSARRCGAPPLAATL